MIEIDGSLGEGGGQIVRSSLALSLLSNKPFRIFNLRAGRSKPGLRPQHLTAVRAAAEIGDANLVGDEVGSEEIIFTPTNLQAGNYRFEVPTAGSATLVFQTVLPALMMCDAASEVTFIGGTHNMLAPPLDFVQRSYLPQLAKIGPQIKVQLSRFGFFPAGNGEFEATIGRRQTMRGLEIKGRGKLLSRKVIAIVAALPTSIAHREIDRVVRKLNWDRLQTEVVEVGDEVGPGNVLLVELEYENVTTIFSSFGKVNVPAERVADAIVRDVRSYVRSEAPVGPNLADQLMLPMAIAASSEGSTSSFRTGNLTQHSITHAEIIQRFLDVEVRCDQLGENECVVSISR